VRGPDGVREALEGTDQWSAFELYSTAKAELDRLLDLDDTYAAALGLVLDGDGSYDEPPRPAKFTDSFWRMLKHQMATPSLIDPDELPHGDSWNPAG
jgi:hypothetical protein